jgi:hypothetical protein
MMTTGGTRTRRLSWALPRTGNGPKRASLRVALVSALLVLAAVLAAVVATGGLASATRQAAGPDQLVPLYEDNANDWATACSETNGANGGSYIIADVDAGSGAGAAPEAAWATVIDNCDSYGKAEVLGYVWTDYGKGGAASIPAIEAQVKDWYSFYPGHIAGIFFDGAADDVPGTGASNVSFYQTLDSYVHQNWKSNDEVVLNYGANPASGWMFNSSNAKNADIVVIFEGSYSTAGENPYVGGGWAPARWESQYPADDFAALMYDTNSTTAVPQPETACAALTAQHIGYVYVGTWYTTLAPYFSTFAGDC